MALLWPSAGGLLVLPPGYQAEIRDRVQAQMIITQILLVLDGWSRVSNSKSNISDVDEPWLLECCYRLQEICARTPGISSEDNDCVISAIAVLLEHHVLARCPKHKPGPVADLLSQLMDDLDVQEQPNATIAMLQVIGTWSRVLQPDAKERLWLHRHLTPNVQRLLPSSSMDTVSESHLAIRQTLELLTITDDSAQISAMRPAKRRRTQELGSDRYNLWREQSVCTITRLLTGTASPTIPRLDLEEAQHMVVLGEEDRNVVLNEMGRLPCVLSRSIDLSRSGQELRICHICDAPGSTRARSTSSGQLADEVHHAGVQLLGFLSQCVEFDQLKRSKPFRIAAANTIRRIVHHMNDAECSLLAWNGIGPWLMRSLQSSVRELRVASAKALVAYLREDLPTEVKERNRYDAIGFIRLLADKDILHVQETLAFTWGLIGRMCGDSETNLALIELVDYLGHSHPIISGAAYQEIVQLADFYSCTPLELVRPYWRSLASHVVKDIYVCPQKIQQLADLLYMSVSEFLVHTQADTVPFLVLTRKTDVLQRIAQARGPSIAVHDLWLQPSRNLAAVLGLLLIQPVEDAEQSAIALLKDASPSFAEHDLSSLIKVDPIQISCEILKHAADFPDSKKPQAHEGLRLLAWINERKPGISKAGRSSKTLLAFLEGHILGIMSHFSDILDAAPERQLLSEKKRALQAVEQLIIVGQSRISIAVPQIRATLQSAAKNPELVDIAFNTWSTLVAMASEDEVEPLITQTFAVIAHQWTSFSPETQKRAYDTLDNLIKNHNATLRDIIQFLPSLTGIEVLRKFENEITRFKQILDPMLHFQAFAIRLMDENAVIVHRALIDLVPYLEVHQGLLHESAVSQQPSPIIAQLSRALFDVVLRFKEHEPVILELAARSLGAIGSIDPNKVDESREKHDILMLSNFEKAEEVINFVIDLLERVLVDAFHSAPTGRVQTYLAYAMQELLKFCGFRQVLYKARSSQSSPLYQRWMRIPESVRSTLTPFFNTRYALVHASEAAGIDSFPILKPGMTHGTWLRTFAFNLLHQATTENTQMVFPVLSRIIWGHDIAIPTFLLPYVVLNIVVDGDDDHTAAIKAEFLGVLSLDLDVLDEASASEVKQCSEVSPADPLGKLN